MKTTIQFSLITLMAWILGCASVSPMKIFSSSGFKLRPYKEVTLKNGLKVLLVKDNWLPSFSLQMLVKSGSVDDPKEASGVASMVAQLLNQGTAHRDAVQITDSLGQVGATWHAGADKEYTLISLSGLSHHSNVLMKDFFEIVTEPAFSEAELNRIRSRTLASIRQLVDDPRELSSDVFDGYIYGPEHPYSRRVMGTLASVKSIRRKHIIKYYLQAYRPNNSVLAVVGKFDDGIERQIEELTKNWEGKEVKAPEIPAFPEVKGIKIRLVTKSDLKQAQILFGQPGIRRADPDFIPIRVANTVLSAPFSSPLFIEVREKRGLTYHISSQFDARVAQGPFYINTSTRLDKVNETITQVLAVLKDFHNNGANDGQIDTAKSYLKGMFPRALETSERTAQQLLLLRFFGISDDYLKTYLDVVSETSVGQVNREAHRFFDPENIRIQVYAPRSVLPQLKSIGTVEEKSYQDFL